MSTAERTYSELRLSSVLDLEMDPLTYVLRHDLVSKSGLWLEFGVFTGSTLKLLASFRETEGIYGFDSFEGLPEEWVRGHRGWWSDKGAFSTGGVLPKVPDNVKLVKGWFDATIDDFLKTVDGKITLLHIDCDLYSSTRTVFQAVAHRLDDTCVIVFDEIFNYPGWENHEAKALMEFLAEGGWDFTWIGMRGNPSLNPTGSDASIQSAALVVRRKTLAIDYDVVHGSFFTESYAPGNEYLVSSLIQHSYNTSNRINVDNKLLSEVEYVTEGVRAFQRGNTIKWRLLVDTIRRHLYTGVIVVYTDSDGEFKGPLTAVLEEFLRSDCEIAFQLQNEGVHENHMPSASARWKSDINIGFIVCYPTKRLLVFLENILEICDTNRRGGIPDNPSQEQVTTGWDQMVINEYLHANPLAVRWHIFCRDIVGKSGTVFSHHLAAQKSDFMRMAAEASVLRKGVPTELP